MKRLILVADTDPGARDAAQAAAELFGAEAVFAADDREAQKVFIEQGPDVIVADILLPRRGPFDFLKTVRNQDQGSKIPVILTSSLRAVSDAQGMMARELGASIMRKPLSRDALADEFAKSFGPGETARPSEEVWLLGGDVADEGAFDRLSFPLVFARACFLKNPARLAVTRDKTKKVFSFADNKLTFAASNLSSDTLARHLLMRAQVSEEGYRRALKLALEKSIRIGQAFVELEETSQETVDQAVRRNIIEKTLDVFTWDEGHYRIIAYDAPPAPIPGGDIPGESILWTFVMEQSSPEDLRTSLVRSAESVPGPLQQGRSFSEMPGPEILGRAAEKLASLARVAPGMTLADLLKNVPGENYLLVYFLLLNGYLLLPPDQDLPPLDPRMRKALTGIRAKLDWLKKRNAFQILGVATSDNDDCVRKAFEKLVGEFGPAAVSGFAGMPGFDRLARKMTASMNLVQRAYDSIKTEEGRKAYLATSGGLNGAGMGDESVQLKAETAFREGIEALRNMSWQAAFEAFSQASSSNPAEPEYILYAGIARRHQDNPTRTEALKEAEELLREACQRMVKSAEPFYQLGRVQEALGESGQAIDTYGRALSREPGHDRTQKRLKFLEDRSKKTVGERFGKFLGRKQ